MTDYIETEEHAGLTIGIWMEQYIEEWMSPRLEDDGLLGVMFCDYPRYNLGDKDAPDPRDQMVECDRCEGNQYVPWEEYEGGPATPDDDGDMLCPKCEGQGEIQLGIVEYLQREHGARVVLPLFVYEHSGITMRCGLNLVTGSDTFRRQGRYAMDAAGWDTSSVGVIFDTEESRKRCGWDTGRTDEEIEKDLAEEVRYYAAYLENMVFGYDVIAAKEVDGQLYDVQSMEPIDNLDEAETLESCGGFLDPDGWSPEKSYVYAEARSAAESCIEGVEHEKVEAYRWACADVVTV